MTYSGWQSEVSPKVAGAWNFHNAFLSAEITVDFFIMLSSVAGVLGNRGQAAYAAANTFLDSFASFRQAQGLPAISLDLTAVSDIGVLANNSDLKTTVLKTLDAETMNETEVLALLAAAISGRLTCATQCITGLKILPHMLKSSFWVDDPKFSLLRKAAEKASSIDVENVPKVSLDAAIKAAKTDDEIHGIIYSALTSKLSAVLMLPVEEMDPAVPVVSYGLDSLVAIEIRNWINRELNANFQVLELLTSVSLAALVETVIKKRSTTVK